MPSAPAADGRAKRTEARAQTRIGVKWYCGKVSMNQATRKMISESVACPSAQVKKLKAAAAKAGRSGKSACGINVGAPVRSSVYLKASYSVFCSSIPAPWWSQSRYERSSWSGYRPYSNWKSGPVHLGNSGSEGITNNSTCGSGGTYDYHLSVEVIQYPGVPNNSKDGPARRFTCGTGIS